MHLRLDRYILASASYCVLRKTLILHDAKVKKYSYKLREWNVVPMLTTTKLLILGSNAAVSPIVWPLWMTKDIAYLEMILRNIDPAEYDIKPCYDEMDYILK